jgi:protein-S-isoprenylcysteine O-methyltransferase Ste14
MADSQSAAFTPAGSTIPSGWHFAVALGAGACLALLYFSLAMRTTKNTWIHDFFFERSFVQWVTLYVFFVGLGLLLEQVFVYWRELCAFRIPREQQLHSDGVTGVSRRFRRLHIALQQRPPAEVHNYAKQLAEADATDLDFGHNIVGEAIQILPLLGFFGTVLGLSLGLHQAFLEGKTEIAQFATAIGTAFDTTLMGLACCIILIILQLLIRKREDSLLADLDRAADNFVARHYMAAPAETARDRIAELRDQYASELKDLLARTAKSLQDIGASAAAMKQQLESLNQASDPVQKTYEALQASLQCLNQSDGNAAELLATALRKEMQPVLDQFTAEVSARAKANREELSSVLRDTMKPFVEEIAGVLSRPRRISVLEQPEAIDRRPET